MVSRMGKDLLKNMILHTDSHNKRVEIAEMWQQKETMSRTQNFFNHDDRLVGGKKRGYSGSYDGEEPGHKKSRSLNMDEPSSTYWSRQLQKLEEVDPDRWGHGGYKELYPEEFHSDRSDEEHGAQQKCHKKKKHKVKKKKNSKGSVMEESETSDGESMAKKSKHKRKKKRVHVWKETEGQFSDSSGRSKDGRTSHSSANGNLKTVKTKSDTSRKSRNCAKKSKHKHKHKKKI